MITLSVDSFGITIDTRDRKLVWTDYTYNRIMLANFDGSGEQVIIGIDLDLPAALIIEQERR